MPTKLCKVLRHDIIAKGKIEDMQLFPIEPKNALCTLPPSPNRTD